MKSISKNFLKVAAATTAFFGIVGVAAAIGTYTPPTSTPPGANVDAPINVGTTSQTKTGGLTVGAFSTTSSASFTGSPFNPSSDVTFPKLYYAANAGNGLSGLAIRAWNIGFKTGNSGDSATKMILTNTGRLGIGTMNPNHPLDVIGVINTNDNLYAAGLGLFGGGIRAGGMTAPSNALSVSGNADVSGAVAASQFCLGASCISSWPAGGGSVFPWHMSGDDSTPVAQLGTSAVQLSANATGAIELGNGSGGSPFIDFHSNSDPDFDTRIINYSNQLDIQGGNLTVGGSRVVTQGIAIYKVVNQTSPFRKCGKLVGENSSGGPLSHGDTSNIWIGEAGGGVDFFWPGMLTQYKYCGSNPSAPAGDGGGGTYVWANQFVGYLGN